MYYSMLTIRHRSAYKPMPLSRAMLIATKRGLLGALSAVQDCAAAAWRAGDDDLAARLRDVAERLADELDYIDRQIAGLA
jgi:hypothetical protein